MAERILSAPERYAARCRRREAYARRGATMRANPKFMAYHAGRRGIPLSDEHRANVGAALRGRSLSAEHRAKVSAAQKGRPKSAEHRANIAAGHRRLPLSDEQKAKLAAANRGKTHSPETRAKMSASRRGRPQSAEHTAKVREAVREAMKCRREALGFEPPSDRTLDFLEMYRLLPSVRGLECVYCGRKATTRDHVVPFIRGGRATLDNLVPACRRCNGSKASRTPDEWLAAGLYARWTDPRHESGAAVA